MALPERKDMPREHTWNAESVFATPAGWDAVLRHLSDTLPALAHFHGRLAESATTLADWLHTADEIGRSAGRLFVYAGMAHSVDTADAEAAARYEQAIGLAAHLNAALAFAEPEMLAIPEETLNAWAVSEPRLAHFGHYFDQLAKKRPHVRSAEVEELLGRLAEPFSGPRAIHNALANTDIVFRSAVSETGEESEVAQGTIGTLLANPDPETRRTAWESYADGFLAHKHSIAASLAAGVKQNVFLARARHYGSSLEASLAAGHIPETVFHNLIATYRKHLPTWHRYWEIRRRALGTDRLRVCDVKAPLTARGPHVPFAQAVDWICEGMRPLGEEYVRTLRTGVLEERWVDVYPNKGKRMGAFSSGTPGTHPFILMSYSDDLFGLSTLAHELGHSLHSFHTWRNQPGIYAHYGLFVAEVASNFNQALVRDHLLKTQTEREFQIALLEEAMSNFHRYFFIMPTLARFELEIHERAERGEALTPDRLISLMTELFREGYGDGVEADAERVGIAWAEFPTHLYSNFYVYQYATGISGAHALAEGVLAGKRNAAENYLSFLKAGGSLYPLDALKLAGVDLTSPEPVERTFAVLAGYVDRLEALVSA